MNSRSNALILALSICIQGTVSVNADDWPNFRGPDRTGISKETGWNPAALSAGPKIAWKAEVGKGYSSFAVVGDSCFTMGNADNKDTLYCLKATDGSVIWAKSYDCPAGGSGYPGPRATPTVSGKLVYTIGNDGTLACFDITSGDIKWKKNLISDFKAKNIKWGFSASPLVIDNMLILNAGECGIALNKESGEKIWANSPGTGGYAVPVLMNTREPSLAIFGEGNIFAVGIKTGQKKWAHPWKTEYDVNAADPIVTDKRIFISSGYDKGCTLLDISAGAPKELWTSKVMRNHFSSSILLDGHIFGIDGNNGKGALKCVEMETGNEKWKAATGFGSLIMANGKLIVLNEKGDLMIADAATSAYKEVSKAAGILSKVCWTPPVLSGGRIFCRNNNGNVACIDVRK